MDLLSNIKVFIEIAELNSLAGAAQKLNISASSVSKQISSLEDRLGVRLLNRTTRRVSITDIGEAYLEKAKNIIEEVEQAEDLVSASQISPRGLLKIAAPSTFGSRHIAPHLPLFLKRYPDIKIELLAFDDHIDIIKESIDIAIRLTELEDSSLIARKIAPGYRTIVANSAYLNEFGEPKTPNDLLKHRLVTYRGRSAYNDWHFIIDGNPHLMHARGTLTMSSGEHILRSVLNGGGITMLSGHVTGRQVRDGRLKLLLQDYVREETPIYAVYPSNKHLSPKVRKFVDFLLELYQPKPYWMPGEHVNIDARERALI